MPRSRSHGRIIYYSCSPRLHVAAERGQGLPTLHMSMLLTYFFKRNDKLMQRPLTYCSSARTHQDTCTQRHRSPNMLRIFRITLVRSSVCLNFSPVALIKTRAACASFAVSAGTSHSRTPTSFQSRSWHISVSAKASAGTSHSSSSADDGAPTKRSATYRGSTSSGVAWAYEGEVDAKGRKDGLGKCSWDNGDAYLGLWKSDEKHGKGVYSWPGGKVYDGEWQNDRAEGFGRMTYPDGAVYEGAWQEGFRCGHGVATWPSGMIYDGEWSDGKRNGQGKLTAPDGSVYFGEWSDGVPHGNGSMTYPGGRVDRGVWKLGKKI